MLAIVLCAAPPAAKKEEKPMLFLTELIGSGCSRNCYRHPDAPGLCVKVAQRPEGIADLRRELKIAALVRPYLGSFMLNYGPDLVPTDKGPGLVCELLTDAGGRVSPSLYNYRARGGDVHAVESQINANVQRLIENDLFFYDFNHGNAVVQTTATGERRLRCVDLKSLHQNGYCGFLKLEKFIAPLARIIMYRRLRHIYSDLGLRFPFDRLCHAKMLSSFWVKIRV